MKITAKCLALLMFMSGLGSMQAGEVGGEQEVSLSAKEIKDTDRILTKSDLNSSKNAGQRTGGDGPDRVISIRDGAIVTANEARFTAAISSAAVNVGGKDVVIQMGNSVSVIYDGKSKSLKKKGKDYGSADFTLENGLNYAIAFPYGDGKGKNLTLFYRCGTELQGKLGMTKFALYDDNLDGSFGASDTFSVNDCNIYAPMKELIPSSNEVYKVTSIDDKGGKMIIAPHDGEKGTISVKWKGTNAEAHMAFGSSTMNLTSSGKSKTLTVVTGDYDLLYGYVYSKKSKKIVAGISKGKMDPVSVENGKAAKATLGKPFTLCFKMTKSGQGKVTISPQSIYLIGKAGEYYTDLEIMGKPSVSFAKSKKKQLGMGTFETG